MKHITKIFLGYKNNKVYFNRTQRQITSAIKNLERLKPSFNINKARFEEIYEAKQIEPNPNILYIAVTDKQYAIITNGDYRGNITLDYKNIDFDVERSLQISRLKRLFRAGVRIWKCNTYLYDRKRKSIGLKPSLEDRLAEYKKSKINDFNKYCLNKLKSVGNLNLNVNNIEDLDFNNLEKQIDFMKELLYYTKKYIANEKYKFCDEPYFEHAKRKTMNAIINLKI
ncbi:hypothetical protein [Campylobacter phage vB_CcoM-IBB_35]|uniref:Uncharacterized protein n=1 Tax=Campylobacter virus IBB35 TaxID=1006972 RepID=H6SUM6_9CAUD|nr:hypothetical protein FDG52_s5gp06 [Campylobacter phage vB_CcoM-IBB_35]AEI88243.1 hypothetical protein [Campylobacter phage vB_CcoM-IBB_35]